MARRGDLTTKALGLLAFFVGLFLVIAATAPTAIAQDDDSDILRYPLRPADTSSPRDTLRSFLTNFDRMVGVFREQGQTGEIYRLHTIVAETLDFSAVAHSDTWTDQTKRMALLKEVLDRLELPPFEAIPGNQEVAANDIRSWTIPNSRITIERLETGPRSGQFAFSARSVEQLEIFYRRIKHLPYQPGSSEGIYDEWLTSDRSLRAQTDEIRNRFKGLDTSSPRATLEGFLDSVNRAHKLALQVDTALRTSPPMMSMEQARIEEQHAANLLRRAADALDLSTIPPSYRQDVGTEATLLLKEVLDRTLLPPIEAVPGPGRVAENRQSGSGQPLRWIFPNTQIEIVEITEGERAGQFLFSAATVQQVGAFYKKLQDLPYRPPDYSGAAAQEYVSPGTSKGFYEYYISTPGNLVPGTTFLGKLADSLPTSLKAHYRGKPIWQWLALGICVLVLLVVSVAVFQITGRVNRGVGAPLGHWIALLAPLIVAALVGVTVDFLDNDLNLTGVMLVTVRIAGDVIVLFLFAWATVRFFLAAGETIISLPRIAEGGTDVSLVRIVSGVLSIVGAVVIIVAGLQDLGVDAVPLLAGLGVGGLAVALAIRPTLENLIGGLILFIDKPVRVGDYCTFGGMAGTVEKIGPRSTLIRALDRTLIAIPNAKFVDMEIINWARCDRMLMDTTIGLRYETTPDQLRYVLVKLREMFHAHPRIDRETVRVRFTGFGASSQDIRMRVYALTREWNDFHAIREDVLLRTSDIVNEAGTSFAFPSQTFYVGRDEGLDEERSQAAMQEVQAWRKSWKLPFPSLPEHKIDKLEGTLDYPPRGSPDAFMPERETSQKAEPLSAEPEEESQDDESTQGDGASEKKSERK